MPLSFEVQLRPDDYRMAARVATRGKGGRALLLGTLVALVPVIAWSRTDPFGVALASVGAGLAAGLLLYGLMAVLVVPGRTARLAARMDPNVFATPTQYAFDEQRLRVIRPFSATELTWAMFTRAWEGKEVFGLELGNRTAVLPIPKRGLSQPEVERVREFAALVGITPAVTNVPR